VLPGTPLYRDRERHGLRAGRDELTGAWRTVHAYDVDAVRPAPRSSVQRTLWDEASELTDAICARPREERASDGAAWAVLVHRDEPDDAVAAWLRDVLAVGGAVVAVASRARVRADRAAWLRALDRAGVPWGTFALLSPDEAPGARAWTSLGTVGAHRFQVERAWREGGRAIEVAGDGACRVPLRFACEAGPPPWADGLGDLAPQIVDSCRWWSAFRRCRDPRVLHVWPDRRVTPCWGGPAIGSVGDAHAALAEAGRALDRPGREPGTAPERCPLGKEGETGPQARSAAERWEVAAQAAWLFQEAAR
jgi:hypothetical protein